MKMTVRVCRAAKVPTKYLTGCVGAALDATPDQVHKSIKDNFGPLTPGLLFFVEDTKTVIVKEVMSFNIKAQNLPFAGLVDADMLSPREISRVDGAIESELARMGISSVPEEFEWRALYEVSE
jgi:hypothetical protein